MPGSGGTAGSSTVDGGVALYDWEQHPSLLRDSLWRMARGARLCDVKIGFCGGVWTTPPKVIYAHKAVLSACSHRFESIFNLSTDPHPFIIFTESDFSYDDLKRVLK